MTTAFQIVKGAMQQIGVLVKQEDPSADEANDGLLLLNAMLSSWSNGSSTVYARVWEQFTLVGNDGEYTIGSGADFNTVRPIFITDAYTRQDTSDQGLRIISDELYQGIQVKNTLGRPQIINYDNAFPVAKIRLWPVPSQNYELHLLSEKELTQFTLYQDVILPPGWDLALMFNLAVLLAPGYGQPVSPEVVRVADVSKKAINNAIMRNVTMDAQPAATGMFNINTRQGC